jgi:fructokinase
MQRIYAVGETILDIIFRDQQPRAAKPGGSSFNASITLGRLGAPVTMISELAHDRVGDMIQSFMEENGVDSRYVSRYEKGQSAVALAFLNDKSDAEYLFYKDYPHQRLNVDFPDFNPEDLLLFGSFYALNPGIRPRVRALLEKANSAGVLVVYDPNFRSSHLAQRDELLSMIRENMELASIIRASDEDMANVFGVDNPDDAWEKVRSYCPVLIYTANAHAVHLRTGRLETIVEVERIEPVSTIGAGDTFNAGLLYGMYRRGITRGMIRFLEREAWEELIRGAIAFSREVCLSYENYLPLDYARRVKDTEPG